MTQTSDLSTTTPEMVDDLVTGCIETRALLSMLMDGQAAINVVESALYNTVLVAIAQGARDPISLATSALRLSAANGDLSHQEVLQGVVRT